MSCPFSPGGVVVNFGLQRAGRFATVDKVYPNGTMLIRYHGRWLGGPAFQRPLRVRPDYFRLADDRHTHPFTD